MSIRIHVEIGFSFKRDLPKELNPLTVDEEATVQQVLQILADAVPAISARLFDEQGNVRRHINVLVNGGNVALRQGFNTALSEGDRLTILPPVGGG